MPSGGKRKGAGRPANPNKKVKYSNKISSENKKFLKGLKNASKWLDEAIIEKRERE